jgi:DNA-binding NarL/FixJ family response regulator
VNGEVVGIGAEPPGVPPMRGGVTVAPDAPSAASGQLPTQRGASRPIIAGAEILLVDPDPATRESLRRTLATVGVERLIHTGSLDGVRELLDEGVTGDLALVSLTMGAQAPATVALLRAGGWNRVIALAPTADIGPVIDAVGAGVSGVLIGRRANPATASIPSTIHDLSTREIEVIRLVADGRSNKWIGEQLSLSALTVKSHLARIGRKLGTGDRAHMVALAMRAGVIS